MTDDEILRMMKAELLLAKANGLPLDLGDYGVMPNMTTNRWERNGPDCPVCSIGATLYDRKVRNTDVVKDFALVIDRPYAFALGYSNGTLGPGSDNRGGEGLGRTHDYRTGRRMGLALRSWAYAQGLIKEA